MGRLAGESLRARAPAEIVVVGRTSATAATLAGTLAARAAPWHHLPRALAEADVVICSTAAPHEVVTVELMRTARRGTRHPLIVMDIAVPRDVEPAVGHLPGVRLFDIDALQTRVEENLAQRRDEIPRVEAIIDEEVDTFDAWHKGAGVLPLVAELRTWSEALRRAEVERTLRRLGEIPADTREQIDHLTRALINKVLHEPTRRLRRGDLLAPGASPADAIRDLFGLPRYPAVEDRDRPTV
jgi:glutamyl-tRNA reductase